MTELKDWSEQETNVPNGAAQQGETLLIKLSTGVSQVCAQIIMASAAQAWAMITGGAQLGRMCVYCPACQRQRGLSHNMAAVGSYLQ
jgi:hypothetical protein